MNENARDVKTPANALHLLDQIIAHENIGMRLADLKDGSRVSDLTLARTLSTIVSHGYLDYDTSSGRYSLNVKWLEASASYLMQSPLRRVATPHLARLADRFNACASLVVPKGFQVLFVDRVMPPSLHGSLRPPGGTTFWHSTSAGKVIAAFQPDNIIEQYLAENTLKRCTPFTITDPEVLKAHLLAVRSRGWAIDRCENMQSTYCIAAPIYGGSESGIACISLASRTESMLEPPLFDEALTMLRNACSSISGLMGYF